MEFEVICAEETEISLIKLRLTDVFISWFHLRSDEFLTALSGGLIVFRSFLCACGVYLNLAEISSISFHISHAE